MSLSSILHGCDTLLFCAAILLPWHVGVPLLVAAVGILASSAHFAAF